MKSKQFATKQDVKDIQVVSPGIFQAELAAFETRMTIRMFVMGALSSAAIVIFVKFL